VVFAYPESPNAKSAGKSAGTLAGIEVSAGLTGEENFPGRLQRTLRPIGQCPQFRVDGQPSTEIFCAGVERRQLVPVRLQLPRLRH